MEPREQSLILFLIDGLRPDALHEAHTPAIDTLIAYGASTLTARTVTPSITLPCIASLFLGTPPSHHGITSNSWTHLNPGTSLFEIASKARRRTASFYNWEQLRDLARPGFLTASGFLANDTEPEGRGDTALTELAIGYLQRACSHQEPLQLTFIYLGHTDAAGHAHGWMSRSYLRAIENADACIGKVLGAMEGDRESINGALIDRRPRCCGVIVTSDHGGHNTKHGSECDEDMTIPLILYGHPDFAPGQEIPGPVNITDIAPTVAAWMGLTPADTWTGRSLTPQ